MKAKRFLESFDKVAEAPVKAQAAQIGTVRERRLIQYRKEGPTHMAAGKITTTPVLEAGIYDIKSSFDTGIYFEQKSIRTDALLRFPDPVHETVIKEANEFWNLREKYQNLGFVHARGMLLYGPPGGGKSCLVKLLCEDLVAQGDVVFVVSGISVLREGLKIFKEVEPDRHCLVILEDLDELAKYEEHSFLELFDGDSKVEGVFYLGTTNYIHNLSERCLRPGRLDRKIEIPYPPEAGRRAYLEAKLGKHEAGEKITELVQKSKGFSFGHLREMLISHYCLGYGVDETIKRLQGTGIESHKYNESWTDRDLNRGLREHFSAQVINEVR